MTTGVPHTSTSSPIGVGAALRRHWIVALIALLVLVDAAVVVGFKRTARYTATADLSVGIVYANNPGALGTVIQATESLASVYSRAINSKSVQDSTARRLARRSLPSSEQVSATPIAESPLIKITAVATSERQAVELANAASAALADYVNRRTQADDTAAALEERYHRAALRYRKRLDVRRRRAEEYDSDPTGANRAALDRAGAAADTAQLRRDALLVSYQNAIQGADSSPAVEIFNTATEADSDRYATLQLLVFVGLIGGLAAGAGLALLLTHRETRRHADR